MRDLPFRPAIVISIVSAFLQRPDGAFAQPGILGPSFAGFGSNAFTTGEFFYGDHDTVLDALGRSLRDLTLSGVPAGGTAIVDLSQLSPGNYRLRVDGLAGSTALVIAR